MNINIALLILRVSFSAMLLLLHGVPKVKNLMSDNIQFVNIFGMGEAISLILATLAEVVLPILIIIGYKTRIAAIPIVLVMIVAAFVYHANDPISVKEKPLIFLFGFLTIAIAGAGKFSIDKK
ncbi:MAG TPA: DoxX family protein [Flavobacteriaceae bacterium]|nr:DoxX family protein [Flavobacteriaceae bacterium]